MNTFLPYPDFARSAACLDRQRLGKQRLECVQILKVLRGETRGWANHPAVRMWRGREAALGQYLRAVILEWVGRGYRNSIPVPDAAPEVPMPSWLGDEQFHRSHRSNLYRKDPQHYAAFAADGPDSPYVWPEE